jgi:hypothetical protein
VANRPGLPELPPVLYLPCAEAVADPAAARPELRRTRDGRLALLAYTALDRLRDGCGAHQPWVLVRSDGLQRMHEHDPFDLLLLDVVVPGTHRRPAGGPAGTAVPTPGTAAAGAAP